MSRRFLQTRRAKVSLAILELLYLGLVLCQWVSPYTPNKTVEGFVYHPPNLILYSQEIGFGPQIQKHVLVDKLSRTWLPLKGEYEKVDLFSRGEEYRFLGLFPSSWHLFSTKQYPVYIMGADSLGRDIFSRIMYGSRISLTVGILALLISIPIGTILGGIAGYFGGKWDWIIMRASELILLIPGLYLLLFLRSVFLPHATPSQAYIIITVIFSFFSFPSMVRLVRGMLFSIKQEDFVKAARLDNVPSLRIIVRHLLPYVSSIVLISASFSIPATILSEVILGYLGLGITEPSVSWGALLDRSVLNISTISNHPWVLYPSLFLVLASLAFNFFGEHLRDVFDPYHTGEKVG